MSVSSICGNKCTACQVAHPVKSSVSTASFFGRPQHGGKGLAVIRAGLIAEELAESHGPEWCWQRLSAFRTFTILSAAADHRHRPQPPHTGRLDRPERRHSPCTGRVNSGEGCKPSPPPKPPRQRKRTAQTGVNCRCNKVIEMPNAVCYNKHTTN